MVRLLIGSAVAAALCMAGANAAFAVEKTKTEVLGHMSEKTEAEKPALEEETTPEPKKDPSFIPVSKLGEYPDEQEPLQVSGRSREAGVDKLKNIP